MTLNKSFHHCSLALLLCAAAGCEGWNRKSDPPRDLNEDSRAVVEKFRESGVNIADELEEMARLRQAYIEQLIRLEKLYLEVGDMARANAARRQRQRTEQIEVYPYATDKAPEQSSEVTPAESVAEADRMYAEADGLIQSFRKIPLAGTLKANQDKAARAVSTLKDLIRRYPRSDKVDDAAYWIGECYKEYLREDDPENDLALRYYLWAIELNPRTPHPARFQAAVVYDFRLHDRIRAVEMYRRVIEDNEDYHFTNPRYAAQRIAELTDDEKSAYRPRHEPLPEGGALAAGQNPPAAAPADTPADAEPRSTTGVP